MLNEISSLITPEIYEVIYRMGHMDELVLADANYSARESGGRVIFMPIQDNHLLLSEILRWFPLDEDEAYPANVLLPDHGDREEPQAWEDYERILSGLGPVPLGLHRLPREEFYARTRGAYATIRTLDPRLYANIIIRKGVVL